MKPNKPLYQSSALDMACRGKLYRRLVSFAGAMLFFIILVTNNVQAQCPPGWSHAVAPKTIIVSCPSGTCTITVDYCYKILPHFPVYATTTYQVMPTGDILKSGDCDCADSVLFAEIENGLQQTASSLASPCDTGYAPLQCQIRLPYCYKKVVYRDPIGNIVGYGYRQCSTEDFCVQTCDICYANGKVVSSNCSFTVEGTPSCTQPPTPWNNDDDNCYGICGLHLH